MLKQITRAGTVRGKISFVYAGRQKKNARSEQTTNKFCPGGQKNNIGHIRSWKPDLKIIPSREKMVMFTDHIEKIQKKLQIKGQQG